MARATTLIRISFPSPSGGEVGVGLMWLSPDHGPEAGLSDSRRACLLRDGPVHLEAGLPDSRRTCLSRGGPIHPQAGLFQAHRDYVINAEVLEIRD
jgi:hypothetical protein